MIEIESEEYQIAEPHCSSYVTAAQVFSGRQVPPRQHIFLYSAAEWESFLEEWAQFQKKKYYKVVNLGGANDFGIDVAGFCTDKGFNGAWDNYQCKYYKGDALTPGTAIPEIAKVLWHAFSGDITLPQKYYFFAPKDCGPSLKKLFLDSIKLKTKLFQEWDNWCAESITTTKIITLDGRFLEFVDKVDFSIFEYKPILEVIEEHRATPYFYQRFGGGLPDRPSPQSPPVEHLKTESRYISQLFEAYSDREQRKIDPQNLGEYNTLGKHLDRQREAFFHAESLKAFARDTVPPGTFSSLQEEVCSGVIDICEEEHENGFERLKAVARAADTISLNTNGLIQVTKLQDRRGICHQLANVDRLIWVPKDE